jgi:hypothetical protein
VRGAVVEVLLPPDFLKLCLPLGEPVEAREGALPALRLRTMSAIPPKGDIRLQRKIGR